jgi:hypothetical protein
MIITFANGTRQVVSNNDTVEFAEPYKFYKQEPVASFRVKIEGPRNLRFFRGTREYALTDWRERGFVVTKTSKAAEQLTGRAKKLRAKEEAKVKAERNFTLAAEAFKANPSATNYIKLTQAALTYQSEVKN